MTKIIVKENCKVWINGKEHKFEKGQHETNKDLARILVEAGYAERIEEPKKKGAK